MKNSKWKEFRLAELFQVKRGKRLVESDRIPGMRPLVTAGFHNSGIASFIANSEQEIFPKSTITIDMFANAFYRNYSYSADDNVLVLINDDISENCKLFMGTIYQFTPTTICSIFNNTKKTTSFRKSSLFDYRFLP